MSDKSGMKLPIDGFPKFVQDFIFTCTGVYESPWDFWSGAVITSTALAVGDKIELVNKYDDVPILWTCLVGEVSSGKTTPLKVCMKYFEEADSKSIREYQKAKKIYDQKLRSDSGNAGPRPTCFQYVLKDATPEAMFDAHFTNTRGLIYFNDELKGWIDNFGRYNKSGEESNMLSAYTRGSMTINRKSNGEVMNIARACILVTGGIQPELLKDLAKDNRADNGFLSRFCFIYPDKAEKAPYSEAKIPVELVDAYSDYLKKLTTLSDVKKIKLSKDAELHYKDWFNKNVMASNEAPNGYLKGVYGKLDIISLRLAVVVRGMRYAADDANLEDDITAQEMKTAIDITEYFRWTAHKVYEQIFGNVKYPQLHKPTVAKYIHNTLGYPNKKTIAEVLKTSRIQIDRVLKE